MTGLAIIATGLHIAGLSALSSELIYMISAVQVIACAIVGVAINKPDRRVWSALLLLIAILIAAQIFDNRDSSVALTQAISESLFLGVQLILVFGLFVTVQRRFGRDPLNVFFDSLIIGLGSWFLIWVVFLNPAREISQDVVSVTAIRGATLASSAIVIFLLATLLFADTERTPAVWFAGSAIACSLIGDLFYATNQSGRYEVSDQFANAPYIASLFLVSATILHPSVATMASHSARRLKQPLLGRLVLTTTSLVLPVVVLALTNPTNDVDRTVRAISIFVLATAVTLRVVLAVRANAVLQAQLIDSAQTDSLTSLPNRGLMIEHVAAALEGARFNGLSPTVLFIDVDRFKNINDSLGHSAGDNVLVSVAQRLRVALPDRCIVGRISGDEFVVLDAKSKNQSDAVLLADLVLESFHEPLALRQGDVFVSASIGVAVFDREISTSADDLLRNADTAMYRAKQRGRGRCEMFSEEMRKTDRERAALSSELERALATNQLFVVHQPIVSTHTGRVAGTEALLRWNHPERGGLTPPVFLEMAEESGAIGPIGDWVVRQACTDARSWMDAQIVDGSFVVHVNVSARQLSDSGFVERVMGSLRETKLEPFHLALEINETTMLNDNPAIMRTLNALKRQGVKLAIDDFGTGYSSLAHLRDFPADFLKLDGTLVRDIGLQGSDDPIVRSIIQLAHSLNMSVIAEWVTSDDQTQRLRLLGCDFVQGNRIGEPVVASEFAPLVQSRSTNR